MIGVAVRLAVSISTTSPMKLPFGALLTMFSRRIFALGASAAALAGCSPVAVLGIVAGRDDGAGQVASDIPYGDGPRQRLDVYAPVVSAASGRAPIAVFFYGGSWKSGSRKEYAFVGPALAARGFVVAIPDYRLYPEVQFPDFLDDSAAAVRVAREQGARFGGDPDRVVLVGHSAGAYNAAMLALDGRYLARAGVPRGTVKAFAGLSGPYDFLPLEAGVTQEVFGAAPDAARTQPITFASRGDPAAYLATGLEDTTVRPRNTTSLAEKLRTAGVPVLERSYPGLDHADTLLSLTVAFRGRAPILDEMTAFLRERAGR